MIHTNWELWVRKATPGGVGTYTGDIPDYGFDLTDRMMGAAFTRRVEFGEVGEASCEITFDNSDGHLTPFPYDHDTIYDDDRFYDNGLDWFSQWVIYLIPYADLVDGTTQRGIAYTLIPTDVDIDDDGFTSTVTVTGRDFMSNWLERNKLANVSLAALDFPAAVGALINTYATPISADTIETTTTTPSGVSVTIGNITLSFPDGVSLAEVMRQIMATNGGLMFDAQITYFVSSGLTRNSATVVMAQPSNLQPFEPPLRFTDPTGIAAGRDDGLGGTVYDLLPYRNLAFGTDLKRIVTAAYLATAAESSQSTGTNLPTYGSRTTALRELPVATAPSGTSQQFLDDYGDMLTAWWDEGEYSPEALEITGGMIESYAEDDALDTVAALMGSAFGSTASGGAFHVTLIDVPGAGGTLTQAEGTFLQSSLYLTPTDWVLRLDSGIGQQTGFGFLLDDDNLGVLDENRLAAPTKIY